MPHHSRSYARTIADVPAATCRPSKQRTPNKRPPARHPAPQLVTVTLLAAAADDGAEAIATVPVGALEYTRALAPESVGDDATTVTIRVCEHFERHGACNRGHRCRAAHHPAQLHAAQVGGARRASTTSTALPTGGHGGSSASSDNGSSSAGHALAGSQTICSRVSTSHGWRHSPYTAVPRIVGF